MRDSTAQKNTAQKNTTEKRATEKSATRNVTEHAQPRADAKGADAKGAGDGPSLDNVAQLRPVPRRSLSDEVYEQLSGEILAGRMAPGTSLPPERELCTILGVNRGALREAMRRLEQAGLIETRHGSGNTVVDFEKKAGLDLLARRIFGASGTLDVEVVRSIMEMRSSLAPDIARCAAERATPDVIARLDEAVAAMEAAGDDLVALQGHALTFWQALVDGAGNLAYRLAYNSLRGVYEALRPALTGVLAPELTDVEAYRRIARAVTRRDPDKARKQARELVATGERAVNAAVARLTARDGR